MGDDIEASVNYCKAQIKKGNKFYRYNTEYDRLFFLHVEEGTREGLKRTKRQRAEMAPSEDDEKEPEETGAVPAAKVPKASAKKNAAPTKLADGSAEPSAKELTKSKGQLKALLIEYHSATGQAEGIVKAADSVSEWSWLTAPHPKLTELQAQLDEVYKACTPFFNTVKTDNAAHGQSNQSKLQAHRQTQEALGALNTPLGNLIALTDKITKAHNALKG